MQDEPKSEFGNAAIIDVKKLQVSEIRMCTILPWSHIHFWPSQLTMETPVLQGRRIGPIVLAERPARITHLK
jgi:hypothetical protein